MSKQAKQFLAVTTKMRTAIAAILVAAAVLGFTATSAFALTASQKSGNYDLCMLANGQIIAGPSMESCCVKAGGTYTSRKDAQGDLIQSCTFADDPRIVSTKNNVISPLPILSAG